MLEEVDYNEDLDDEQDSKRVKRSHDQQQQQVDGMLPEMPLDPLFEAEEALKMSVVNARSVFHALFAALAGALCESASSASAEVTRAVGAALLNRLLRVFVGTERHLSHVLGQTIVLSNRLNSTDNKISVMSEDALVVVAGQFAAQMRTLKEEEPAFVETWKRFL
jgi:hypothetical protein